MKRTIFATILLGAMTWCHAQTTEEVRAELQRQGVPCANIVLAIQRLESDGKKDKPHTKEKHTPRGC